MDVQAIKRAFGIIGNDPELDRAIGIAGQVAATDLTVLITGESGTTMAVNVLTMTGMPPIGRIILGISPPMRVPEPAAGMTKKQSEPILLSSREQHIK